MTDNNNPWRTLALQARAASRTLKSLGYAARQAVLIALAESLTTPTNVESILAANARDVTLAQQRDATTKLTPAALARLTLTTSKLHILATGLHQLADPSFVPDPVNRLLKQTLVAEDLVLQQRTVPLGVLLVIFESRPDVLPQLVGLAVLSSNGLLLKGGSETQHTLAQLYSLAADAITTATGGRVQGKELVSLIEGRAGVGALLALDDCVDLVIPRGGASLVSFVAAFDPHPCARACRWCGTRVFGS